MRFGGDLCAIDGFPDGKTYSNPCSYQPQLGIKKNSFLWHYRTGVVNFDVGRILGGMGLYRNMVIYQCVCVFFNGGRHHGRVLWGATF